MPADLKAPFDPACCEGGACGEPQSAQYCGCDAGAHYKCERHRLEEEIKQSLAESGVYHEGESPK